MKKNKAKTIMNGFSEEKKKNNGNHSKNVADHGSVNEFSAKDDRRKFLKKLQ